jgi:hypothetical protein
MQIIVNYGYRHYLTTAAWRKKRLQRLELDGFACHRCGSTDRLQVHHIHYSTVGVEDMEDLETLCRACHMREHGKDPTLPPEISDRAAEERTWERMAMLAKQEEVAHAAGVDLTRWITGAAPGIDGFDQSTWFDDEKPKEAA